MQLDRQVKDIEATRREVKAKNDTIADNAKAIKSLEVFRFLRAWPSRVLRAMRPLRWACQASAAPAAQGLLFSFSLVLADACLFHVRADACVRCGCYSSSAAC